MTTSCHWRVGGPANLRTDSGHAGGGDRATEIDQSTDRIAFVMTLPLVPLHGEEHPDTQAHNDHHEQDHDQ
jgi:hypothetical protein